jgi:hypothetical protein
MKLYHPTTPQMAEKIREHGFYDDIIPFEQLENRRLSVRLAVGFVSDISPGLYARFSAWITIDVPDEIAAVFEDEGKIDADGLRYFYLPCQLATLYMRKGEPLKTPGNLN